MISMYTSLKRRGRSFFGCKQKSVRIETLILLRVYEIYVN